MPWPSHVALVQELLFLEQPVLFSRSSYSESTVHAGHDDVRGVTTVSGYRVACGWSPRSHSHEPSTPVHARRASSSAERESFGCSFIRSDAPARIRSIRRKASLCSVNVVVLTLRCSCDTSLRSHPIAITWIAITCSTTSTRRA